jgi:predicted nucleic acid-binding protein
MIFLLDVNALLALGLGGHQFHDRVAKWVATAARRERTEFATCPITELGFLRVLTQAAAYNFTIVQGKDLLSQLKASRHYIFSFLSDNRGVIHLPAWVRGPGAITDGHLLDLAKSNGAILATLDHRIPGALLIPEIR